MKVTVNEILEDIRYMAQAEYRKARQSEGTAKLRHKVKGDAFMTIVKKYESKK